MSYIEGLVSVIIPTYKRADLLVRAVDSVLSQTYNNLECIVINDNVPDDEYSMELYKIVEPFYTDNRFVFLEQEQHINGAAARNYGIRHSHGEYVAFLDDDDWWEQEKLEKQVSFIKEQNSNCGAVSTLVKFYSNGELVRKSLPYKDGSIMFDIISRQTDITTCSVMIKRCCLDETGLFDVSLRRHQEIQLLTAFTEKYEIRLLKEYLTCVDVSTGENNPNSKSIKTIKADFFASVKPQFETLTRRERRIVRLLHDQECAVVFYREHNYKKAFATCLRLLSSPTACYLSTLRVVKRLEERRNV